MSRKKLVYNLGSDGIVCTVAINYFVVRLSDCGQNLASVMKAVFLLAKNLFHLLYPAVSVFGKLIPSFVDPCGYLVEDTT